MSARRRASGQTMGFLEMAKTSLEECLACDHCKPKSEPEEPKGPLS